MHPNFAQNYINSSHIPIMTINYGIDLGTTNSLIARLEGGKVEVFKSPVTWKNTLPSVVAFRNDRIIVGDKAKELVGKDPANVFAFFKRKMGTSELYPVPNLKADKTPIELSALVLRELKTFLHDGQSPEAVVITIPASFDTIQSNATKKAGYEAGFQEVALLQEPVAASLAFANSSEGEQLSGQWLVYDLGGGTFDAALVRLEDGDMRVTDHEGDNYLGGYDFDRMLIEKIVVPHLQTKGRFEHALSDMTTSGGRLEKLYKELIYKAEQVKIQLSSSEIADLEFETEDEEGWELEINLPISRSDFEALIKEKIEGTIQLLRDLLERNNLTNKEIRQVVLVGGSTYIPYVRRRLSETLEIPVNIKIDPTTAVAIGAAYYAGTKTRQSNTAKTENAAQTVKVQVKMAYQKTTQETMEYFTAILEGDYKGLSYRITREDGGFDSGLKSADNRIAEMLPVVRDAYNVFHFKMFDRYQNLVPSDAAPIGILHGKFNLHGQTLPNDICIEVDDIENKTTKLELVFEKNAILPLRKTIVKTISRTISKGSSDSLIINVLEGKRGATPASCLPLGVIEIKGADLPFNLAKGSDVEIELELSESRDLKIGAYVAMTGQEYANVFSPSERFVVLDKLRKEVHDLLRTARRELSRLEQEELFEVASRVSRIERELQEISRQLAHLHDNDSGDLRYQLEEQKRRLAQSLDIALFSNRTELVKTEYFEIKRICEHAVAEAKNTSLQSRFQDIIANERVWLEEESHVTLRQKIDELERLHWEIRQRDPQYVAGLFHYYAFIPDNDYKDPKRAAQLKEMGEKALQRQNTDELLSVIYALYHILPKEKQDDGAAGFVGLG